MAVDEAVNNKTADEAVCKYDSVHEAVCKQQSYVRNKKKVCRWSCVEVCVLVWGCA